MAATALYVRRDGGGAKALDVGESRTDTFSYQIKG